MAPTSTPNEHLPASTDNHHDPAPRRLPVGRTPWDPLNGLRIGSLAGGMVGAGAVAITGSGGIGIVLIAAVTGGAIGYVIEKRHQGQHG